MFTIKKISVASAFRVGALMFALMWGAVGLLFVLLSMMIPPVPTFGNDYGSTVQSATLIGLCSFYLCGIPLYATVGGTSGMLWAFFYNVVSRWVGGLEVTLERKGKVTDEELIAMGNRVLRSSDPFKRKNSDDTDPFADIEGRDYRQP